MSVIELNSHIAKQHSRSRLLFEQTLLLENLWRIYSFSFSYISAAFVPFWVNPTDRAKNLINYVPLKALKQTDVLTCRWPSPQCLVHLVPRLEPLGLDAFQHGRPDSSLADRQTKVWWIDKKENLCTVCEITEPSKTFPSISCLQKLPAAHQKKCLLMSLLWLSRKTNR